MRPGFGLPLRGEGLLRFHLNDYPAIVREAVTEADQVFSGGGAWTPLRHLFFL